MTRLRSIRLVARREILERGRSRGFLFSIAFTTIIIIGSVVALRDRLNWYSPEPAEAGDGPNDAVGAETARSAIDEKRVRVRC